MNEGTVTIPVNEYMNLIRFRDSMLSGESCIIIKSGLFAFERIVSNDDAVKNLAIEYCALSKKISALEKCNIKLRDMLRKNSIWYKCLKFFGLSLLFNKNNPY